jgi:polyferredoxin/formate hydrogenlyase subunit 6/NADH:ubiquinone oxidoreductase subunit I
MGAVVRHVTLRHLRLASQVFFFTLFVFLLVRTEFPGTIRSAALDVRIPWPVGWFLEADPLVALATALSTGTLYRGLIWAIAFLLLAILVGRAFCGWMCPLGSLHHFVSSLKSDAKRGAKLIESNRYKRWQAAKYHLLAAVLVMALFGSVAGLLLDPISFMVRSMSTAVLPAFNAAVRAGIDTAYGWQIAPLQPIVNAGSVILNATILSFKQPHFHGAFLIGTLFVFVLVLNSRVTRFWCRAICPLGALLGVCSRWSLVQMRKHEEKCDDCRRCLLHCQGGDDPIPGAVWRKAECHLCLNCLNDCPTGGINFTWSTAASPMKQTREAPELKRRALITSMAAGVAMVPLMRSGPGVKTPAGTFLIRPPGSLDAPHFLDRCIRCGDCMKVCPNNALHPATLEGGVESLWTPVLVPRIGYCEPNCVLCSQVCPTGAIWEITVAEKTGGKGQWARDSALGASQAVIPSGRTSSEPQPAPATNPLPPAKGDPIRIGTAFYDRGRCLPWAMGVECIVCEEWCPTSPKAIHLVPADVVGRDGETKSLKQPYVDPKLCTGCGACEYACPIKGSPAIYVTSAGETRSRANQFLLKENQPRPSEP